MAGRSGGLSCMFLRGQLQAAFNLQNCGIVDPTAGPIRFSSPISRNLNNGDAIVLLVRHTLGGNMDIRGTCRYAITPPVIFTLHLKFIFHMKFVGARRCSIPSHTVRGGNTVPPLPIDLNSENGDWRRRL